MTIRRPLVLLVDDAEDTRETFAAAFHAAGYTVHPTARYQEALRVIEIVGRVDAVVIEIGFQGDGLRFAERVRLRNWSPRLIAVTGRERTGDPREVLFSAYLLKPIAPDDLVDVVTTILAPPARQASTNG